MSAIAESLAVWHDAAGHSSEATAKAPPVKALLLMAHPDDESECAGLVYRMTHDLGGIVDQAVVTNGAGGHAYAAPAASYYRLPLDKEEGRSHLIQVRREEQLRAGRILGIRHTFFFGEADTGLTSDIQESFRAWNLKLLHRKISRLIRDEKYDLVFILLPTSDTHGHHKAVAVLTLEAVGNLAAEERPAVVGVQTGDPVDFRGLEGFPSTRAVHERPVWSFDRRTPLRCHPALDHRIIVNWAVSEHKSQGFFQMENGRCSQEHFWLFDSPGKDAAARWKKFQKRIEA